MIKYCKSCSKEYSGDYCKHCGYGKKDLEIKAYDKYRVLKPERFMTDEEKSERAEQLRNKRAQQATAAKENTARKRQAQKKKSQWGYIAVAVAVFAAIMVFVLYEGGYIFSKNKTDVISAYFTAIADNDFEKYLGTMLEPMADEYKKEAKKLGLDETEAMQELYSDYSEGYGKGYTVSLKFGNEEKISESDIKESEQTLETAYKKSYNIKDAYKIAVNVTFKGEKKQETVPMYVYIAKIKGDWYILNIEG